MTTIAERVAAGAVFLDAHEPGWWQRIDLEKLALESPCRCVLGQLETPRLQPTDWSEDAYERACQRYGFELDAYDDPGREPDEYRFGFNARLSEYDILTAAWRELIAARRRAQGGEPS